jgi:DNA gyrase subunit A
MDQQNIQIQSINITDELQTSFLDYSMSVIVSRALPDVRDGLKPVHRRILYAMHGLRNYHNKSFLKSARIVGDVIGKYHPHGDSAVYYAMVRLAQDFSTRYLLVDGQGNFGSVDGDPPAAMRYTEVRLQKLTELLLQDLDKETVDFAPNYDNKEMEPVVLPTKVPQLLINGTSGIAVGMATNIPPHNMTEVIEALEALIENPAITIDELLQHVKGPDFPTKGFIHGRAGIVSAYKTGRGSVVMRARAEVEDTKSGRQRIIVTELPYQVNKARLLEKIADLVRNKKIEGISDIRDESSQNEIRVVIDLKRGEMGEIMLNNLYKATALQSSFGMNMVALVKGVPQILNLKQILQNFYQHRREVVLRRTAFELRKAEEKAHILLGLKIAVENVDELVATIRKSPDSPTAQAQLMSKFELSEIQAKSILDMRLAKLTGLEREKIAKEYAEILEAIKDFKDILDKRERVTSIIKDELIHLRENFADERKTEIRAAAADQFTMEKLVADEDVAVTVTNGGYIKRTPTDQIKAQKRGGKGKSGMLTRGEDFVKDVFQTSNHQPLLCFTSRGRVYSLMVYRIPEAALRSKGAHLASLLKLSDGEVVVSILPVREFSEGSFVMSVTRNGYIKKTDLMAYSKIRESGIIGLKLDEGDALVSCAKVKGQKDIILVSREGKSIRFASDDVRSMGRASRGVTGMKLGGEDDRIVGLEVIDGDATVLTVCEKGYGKRSKLDDYRQQSRGGKGVYTIKVTDRNGPVIGVSQVNENDDLMIMTSAGKLVRFKVNEIGVIGRVTSGVRLINVDPGEKVISICKVKDEDGEDGSGESTDAGESEES